MQFVQKARAAQRETTRCIDDTVFENVLDILIKHRNNIV